MYRVTVPATSANLGPGFDCLGAAFDMYNTIEVEETDKGLNIEIEPDLYPSYKSESNLIYKTIKKFFDEVGYKEKGLKIRQKDMIPSTRGLGSSAACIVAGLFAANMITGQKLTKEELANMAALIDGHPDNTTPAIFGGIRATVLQENKLIHVEIDIPKEVKFAAFIPEFTLPTTKARMVLPQNVSYSDAVFNIGRTALLISSLTSGKFENLQCGFSDRLHQPYRKQFIPDIDNIFTKSFDNGARGCYLSGAGPTLIAFIDKDYLDFEEKMNIYLKTLGTKWTLELLNISKKGVEIFQN